MLEFLYAMKTKGYFIAKNIIDLGLIDLVSNEIDSAYQYDQAHINHYEQYPFKDIIHFLFNRGDGCKKLFQEKVLSEYVDLILSDTNVIHSYNAVRLIDRSNNASKVHRDTPRFYDIDHTLSLQALIPIDKFTQKTGATYLLPASHHIADKPTDEYFFENAEQVDLSPGDVLFFDSLIWHCSGENKTEQPRRGVTLVYTRSYMKQQISVCHSVDESYINSLSDLGKRLIGYHVREPSSLEQFLLPSEQRMYKSNQG